MKTNIKTQSVCNSLKKQLPINALLILSLWFWPRAIFSQLPAFPSVDEAYAKVKLTDFADEIQKETGLPHTSFKMLPKTQYMSELNGKENIDKTYFNAYASTRSQELFYKAAPNYPKDECDIYFCAVSPKKGDEEYKSISFKVVYSRLNNDALGQTWKLKKIKYTGFYTYNKKKKSATDLEKEVLDVLMLSKAGEGDEEVVLNGQNISLYYTFSDFARVDSIKLSEEFTSTKSFFVHGLKFEPKYTSEGKSVFEVKRADSPAKLTPYVLKLMVSYENQGGKDVLKAVRMDWSGQPMGAPVVTDKNYKTGVNADFKDIYQRLSEE